MWVEHHNAQANTNNLNKTWAPQQTTGGKNDLILGSQGKNGFQYLLHWPVKQRMSSFNNGRRHPNKDCAASVLSTKHIIRYHQSLTSKEWVRLVRVLDSQT
jgi:hypothetical protein